MVNSNLYEDCIVRLPLYFELKKSEIDYICSKICDFFKVKISK